MRHKYQVVILSLCFITLFFVAPVSASTEEVGVWEGVSHDEEFDFNANNGVTEEQFEKIVQRSMARVEEIRGRPFLETVPVQIYTRSRFRVSDEVVYNQEYTPEERAYLNEYWNALFIVDQETDAVQAQRSVTVENVEAYYNPSNERIVFVADDNSQGKYSIQEGVLIQELTHAMQDQYEGLWEDRLSYKYTDEQLSKSLFIEGEAATIVNAFESRCMTQWDCVQGSSTVSQFNSGRNQGILYSLYFPYAAGEEYIYSQRGRTLQDKIESGYENVPTQTRQYLVDEPRISEPVELFLEDTSTDSWEPYTSYNWEGRETVGQSVVYTMLWYQQDEYNIDLDIRDISNTDNTKQNETHNYRSDLTLDLITDSLVVYRNTETGDSQENSETAGRQGYVWKTIWSDTESASEFVDKYSRILSEHGGEQKQLTEIYSDDVIEYINTEADTAVVYNISSGGFSGKYVVIQDENSVLILNGDSNETVREIRDIADEPTFFTNNSLENIAARNDTEVNDTSENTYISYITSNGFSFIVIFGLILLYAGMYYRDILK